MHDGRIDGHFVVNQNLEMSIRNELGLSDAECKQIDNSVWTDVLNMVNNSDNYEDGNLNIQSGTFVKLKKECWIKIVQIVNNALKVFSNKQIKIEDADEYHDNLNLGKAAIAEYKNKFSDRDSDTLLYQIHSYVNTYKNNKEKLKHLSGNPNYDILLQYIKTYGHDEKMDTLWNKIEILNQISIEEDNNTEISSEDMLKVHNCATRSNMIAKFFENKNIKCTVLEMCDDNKPPSFAGTHSFCVIGLDENADVHNPLTWGENAVIVDAWIGKTFSVQDGINFYKEFFMFNKNTPEHNMYIGTRDDFRNK